MVPCTRLDKHVETASRDVRDYLRCARSWYLGQSFKVPACVVRATEDMVALWAGMTGAERSEVDRLLPEVL